MIIYISQTLHVWHIYIDPRSTIPTDQHCQSQSSVRVEVFSPVTGGAKSQDVTGQGYRASRLELQCEKGVLTPSNFSEVLSHRGAQ